jgi:hypothetical protein
VHAAGVPPATLEQRLHGIPAFFAGITTDEVGAALALLAAELDKAWVVIARTVIDPADASGDESSYE